MKKIFALPLILLSLLLGACAGEEQYSTKYACSFIFYTGYHPTSILNGITTNAGTFVMVTTRKEKGVNHVCVDRNDGGSSEDWAMTTDIENKRVSYDNLGANNSLIIGCATTMEPKAYDGQCPYCLENKTGVNHPLSWADGGKKVECIKCGRKYDLNAEGISTDGNRLLQYHVMTGTGYGGATVLRVAN